MADLSGFKPVTSVLRNRRPGSIGVTGGTLGEAAMQMGIALVLAT